MHKTYSASFVDSHVVRYNTVVVHGCLLYYSAVNVVSTLVYLGGESGYQMGLF